MAAIKIRVGAALEAGVLSVFAPLVKASQKARADIQKNLGEAFSQGPYRTNARKAGEPVDELGKKTKKLARITGESLKDIESQFRSFAQKAKHDLDISGVAKAAEAELKRMERAAGRAALGLGGGRGGGGGGGAIGIGHRAGMRVSRGVAAAYGYGGAILGGLAHGVGINTSMSEMVAQGTENRDLAMRIVNEAPEFNKAGVGERQAGAADLLKSMQTEGNATATDTHEALEGLQGFLAKTGDLATARDVMGNLMRLTRATGTNFADMSNAAADVANNLGDIPDKGEAVYGVMKAIAGQGKLGSIVIRDLARQMAKVASQAGAFEGDKAKNIAILGAMAQEARLHGGAASSQQATTSVMAFVSALRTPSTIKKWAKAIVTDPKTGKSGGLNPYTDSTHTVLRSPQEIISEALHYSRGDQGKLGALFGSRQAFRGMYGFAKTYQDAGAGIKDPAARDKAGLKAVDEEFRRLAAGVMTEADVTNAFNAQMMTTKNQVQIFNNQMQQASDQIAVAFLPAIKDIIPVLVSVAGGLAHFAEDILGISRPKSEQAANSAVFSGFNAVGDIRKFEESANFTRGTGALAKPSDLMVSLGMAQAAPVFAGAGKKNAEIQAQIDEWEKKVAEERAGFSDTSDADIAEAAKNTGIDSAAGRYTADKQTLERLHTQQDELNTAVERLRTSILNGTLSVRIVGGGGGKPVSTDPSGTAPAESQEDPGH